MMGLAQLGYRRMPGAEKRFSLKHPSRRMPGAEKRFSLIMRYVVPITAFLKLRDIGANVLPP